MKKLFVSILGIIFVNALFTIIPSINASVGKGILIVYQFFFNSLFVLSFFLQNRVTFPQPENTYKNEAISLIQSGRTAVEHVTNKLRGAIN
tara:strand:- start:668 stop:940 length:273 start_codon:yes stop_codon:yes gene_type:complete